jgi:hypothetical protein
MSHMLELLQIRTISVSNWNWKDEVHLRTEHQLLELHEPGIIHVCPLHVVHNISILANLYSQK